MLRLLSGLLTFLIVAVVGVGIIGRKSAEQAKTSALSDAEFFRKDKPNDGWIIVGDLEVRFPPELKPRADQKRHRHDEGLQDWRPDNEWAYGVSLPGPSLLPGSAHSLIFLSIEFNKDRALSYDLLCQYRQTINNMIFYSSYWTMYSNIDYFHSYYIDNKYLIISKNDNSIFGRRSVVTKTQIQFYDGGIGRFVPSYSYEISSALSSDVSLSLPFLLDGKSVDALSEIIESIDLFIRSNVRRRDGVPWPMGQQIDDACTQASQHLPMKNQGDQK